MSEAITKAKYCIEQAIDQDKRGNYLGASSLYEQGIQFFLLAIKYEKNPATKAILEKRTESYITRLEQIRDFLKSEPKDDERKVAEMDVDDDDKLKTSIESAILKEKPDVTFDDIAGLDSAKVALKEATVLPIKFPSLFTGKRKAWRGILLYGTPGNGKSLLAKAVANQVDSSFLSVSSSDLISKWQGESARLVKQLFETARENKPSVVFIDEIDALAGARGDGDNEASRRVKTELLVQMDGAGYDNTGVLVLAATNTPWSIDSAARRRFQKRIYVPMPDLDARVAMFKIHIGDTPNNLSEDDFKSLGERTEFFSGSDINIVVREALMGPIRFCQRSSFFMVDADGYYTPLEDEVDGCVALDFFDVPDNKLNVPDVTMSDFEIALGHIGSSISPEELIRFEKWRNQFGSN